MLRWRRDVSPADAAILLCAALDALMVAGLVMGVLPIPAVAAGSTATALVLVLAFLNASRRR